MVLSSAALTTTFTPSPSCTNNFYTNVASNYYSIGGPLASQCFPSGWQSTSQFFSPGVCPFGYTQACSALSITGSVTETQATCCPSGYTCYLPSVFNFVGQACASVFATQITTTVTDGTALTVMVATLHPKSEAVNGYGVSILYKNGDFASSSSPASSPATTTQNHLSTTSPTSSSTGASSTTTAATAVSGLSTGAKAGIGAGVGAVALIALLGLLLFFFRWKKAKVEAFGYTEALHEMPATETELRNGKRKTVHEVYTLPSELG